MVITLGPVMFLFMIPIVMIAWAVTFGSKR